MNTCIHSASHGTVNSVNTRSAYLPLCISHPHPSAALAPSRLAARRPRSRRPGRARRPSRRSCPSRCPTSPPAALPAFFSFSVSSSARNACSSDVVQVHLLRMCSTMRVLPPQKVRPQSLHTTLGVWLISWPTTVTVAQILPVRNGIITGAARFLNAPTDLKGVSSPVVRAAAAAGAASGAAVGACITSAVADVSGRGRRVRGRRAKSRLYS